MIPAELGSNHIGFPGLSTLGVLGQVSFVGGLSCAL